MKSISFSLYIAILFLFTVINGIIYATPTPIPTPIAGDGNLCGQVTDAVTGKGINGATVTVELTGQTGITGRVQGQDGIYCITPVPEGAYIFTAEAENYFTSFQSINVTAGNPNPHTCTNIFNLLLLRIPFAPTCESDSITASPNVLMLKKEESGNVIITCTCGDGSLNIKEIVTAGIKSGRKHISILPQSAVTNTCGQAVFKITATKQPGNAKMIFVTTNGLTTTVTVKVRGE